jgi:hypothetical protein
MKSGKNWIKNFLVLDCGYSEFNLSDSNNSTIMLRPYRRLPVFIIK